MGFKPAEAWGGERANGAKGPGDPNVLDHLTAADLLQYGFIPELVGRFPVTTYLDALDQSALVRVLTEPKNAIVKQYEQLFSMDNVELSFTPKALEAAAQEAITRATGARGLRGIIEETLLDVMYELPSLKEAERCIVDEECISGRTPPALLTGTGQCLEFPIEYRRLA